MQYDFNYKFHFKWLDKTNTNEFSGRIIKPKEKWVPDSCDSRGFRLGSTVNSVIDAIGPIESVTSLLMQFPSTEVR